MSLDINTPKGQEYLKYERYMLNKISQTIGVIETPKTLDSEVDGFIYKDELIGCFESKCRNMTRKQLHDWGGWLISYDKILKGCDIAKRLRINFYGFLYLIPDDEIYTWKIADNSGDILIKMHIERTKTQASCNGGSAIRTNAYLDFQSAKLYT